MEVLVIGGSVAGLKAAEELLLRGIRVVVKERRPSAGKGLVCAGGISAWALRYSGLRLPPEAVTSRVRRFRIYGPSGEYWEGRGEGVLGYVVRREILERRLAERVERLGGEIEYGRKVETSEVRKLSRKHSFLVGADGIGGATRRALGFPLPSPRDVHLGIQQTCSLPGHPQDRIDLYLGKRIAPQGYAWIFPAGEKKVKVGLGVPLSRRVDPRALLNRFLERICAEPLGTRHASAIRSREGG